jgi:hypothetical protein
VGLQRDEKGEGKVRKKGRKRKRREQKNSRNEWASCQELSRLQARP